MLGGKKKEKIETMTKDSRIGYSIVSLILLGILLLFPAFWLIIAVAFNDTYSTVPTLLIAPHFVFAGTFPMLIAFAMHYAIIRRMTKDTKFKCINKYTYLIAFIAGMCCLSVSYAPSSLLAKVGNILFSIFGIL